MFTPIARRFAIAISISWLIVTIAAAQTTDSRDEDDEPPEYLPGLIAQYETADSRAQRIDRDILFDWSHYPVDSRLEPGGDFSASWQGALQVKANGIFQLRLFVCGKVSVMLAGKPILDTQTDQPEWKDCESIELRFGKHDLKITFAASTQPARLGLYWSGPGFQLEPISASYLFHASESTIQSPFEMGQALARGLRCAACHELGIGKDILAAPALTHLGGNLQPSWLVARLMSQPDGALSSSRMPHFGMSQQDAAAIAAALFEASIASKVPEAIEPQLRDANKRRGKKDPEIRTIADLGQGQISFASTGCLACHQVGELGTSTEIERGLFGGGDLTNIAAKRTPEFFHRLVEDPSHANPKHRMPKFELSLHERLDVGAYLRSLNSEKSSSDTEVVLGESARGAELVRQFRCGACHELPASLTSQLVKTQVKPNSDWEAGCLQRPDVGRHLPGFGLGSLHRDSLREYFASANSNSENVIHGARLLVENNCTACHSRDLTEGIKSQLAAIVQAVPALAPRLAAAAPPSLTAIGDKLHEQALIAAIARNQQPLRPWLDVRMPKFELSRAQLDAIAHYLIAHDRIPEREVPHVSVPHDKATELAAGRLVTSEGFGCQSCHQIGDGDPPKVDLNARGTNLAMLGDRIRPAWFQRWVRNPARIVAKMEMPAIQTAVHGVLDNSLDLQLEALWQTLNTPGFRPPRPGPVRVVRAHNVPSLNEPASLLTDVLETPERVYLRPLLFGLPNRHNMLFDLEAGSLSTWWMGDTAGQHTRGKTWFWEPGTALVLEDAQFLERIELKDSAGRQWTPQPIGQFAVVFDSSRHIQQGVEWQGRIHLSSKALQEGQPESRWLKIKQTVLAAALGPNATTQCVTELADLQPGDQVQLISSGLFAAETRPSGAVWNIDMQLPNLHVEVASRQPIERLTEHRISLLAAHAVSDSVSWQSTYHSLLATDEFPIVVSPNAAAAAQPMQPKAINVVPGFEGIQLPLPSTEMPISFAWDASGKFFAGSLKGRVLELKDDDGDGLVETYEVISDEIPTPFGLYAHTQGVDALAKFALIRLTPPSAGGTIRDAQIVSDGWGYTADYHDWAVGLERDEDDNYYMALPCQQDDRSQAAAYLRGSALKLVPYESTEEPRKYRIEPIAAGLRFPMGIALSTQRELFTSDNQGNYNPFNELNHLRYGKRYGFINKLENKDGFSPAFESPAINLPHPWVRSVNGICFLRSPKGLKPSGQAHFGPFEGHLVGCEMNGKSLIRMSLQKVGETYQGAAYMFSRPVVEGEANIEGPIVCEISPAGDLVVGSLQDSGWSGGQNTGSVVQFRPTHNLPLGIAEVRGTSTGFEIDFTGIVDRLKAQDSRNYSIRSYQRISTPAYGGDDQDERAERIGRMTLSEDAQRVTLEISELRAGFVYELNIAAIGPNADELFPSQAHYSMRAIPLEQRTSKL